MKTPLLIYKTSKNVLHQASNVQNENFNGHARRLLGLGGYTVRLVVGLLRGQNTLT